MGKRTHNYRFAYCPFKPTDERGFTLLETMTALMVTSLTVLLISFAVRHFQSIDRFNFHSHQLEWHIFLNQLEYDLEGTTFQSSSTQGLIVSRKTEDNIIVQDVYRKSKGKFVKDRTGGHEPMLMQVAVVHFQREGFGLRLTVTFSNEETYTAWIDLRQQMGEKADE